MIIKKNTVEPTLNNWKKVLYFITPSVLASGLTLYVVFESFTTISPWNGLALIIAFPFFAFVIFIDWFVKRLLKKNVLQIWLIELFIIAAFIVLLRRAISGVWFW